MAGQWEGWEGASRKWPRELSFHFYCLTCVKSRPRIAVWMPVFRLPRLTSRQVGER